VLRHVEWDVVTDVSEALVPSYSKSSSQRRGTFRGLPDRECY